MNSRKPRLKPKGLTATARGQRPGHKSDRTSRRDGKTFKDVHLLSAK